MTKPHIKYRPDIDGLRALAVVSVMIFHFNSDWLPGGFLGVDIFFVISGYLITSIISRQIAQNRFTFRDFYTRRIKRILPLFFVVLLVTTLVAIILFDTRDFEEFWRTAKYAMQFRANRAFSGQGYFSPISEEKPLLHLWSLAIEEQFYFVWPLSFFLIYKAVKNRKNPQVWLFWITIFGICLSLLYAQYRLVTAPNKAYFELSSRASELLVGCALALNPYNLHDKYKRYLGSFSIVVLILCFIFYSSEIPFPGISAMLPTIAAAFFIFDTNVNATYKRVFTNPIVRTIGLWSFSLYLWHWPVLAFMRYVQNDTQLPNSWLLLAAMIIIFLSVLTYYLVENPSRRTKFKFLPSLVIIYIIPFVVMVGVHHFATSKPISTIFRLDDPKIFTNWAESEQICMDSPINDSCYVGDATSPTKILVIGDSHAGHLANFMEVVGEKEKFKAHMLASGGCAFPMAESMVNNPAISPSNTCALINQYLLEHNDQYDAVVISQYLAPKFESPEFIESNYPQNFQNIVETVAKNNKVYLISDTHALIVPSILRYWKLQKLGIEHYMKNRNPADYNRANEYLKNIANNNPNVYFVDINQYIPESGVLDDLPLYFDNDHLNLYGSKRIGEFFIEDQTLLQNQE